MNKEQKFYSILQDLFVGAKLEGDGGYVNLMNIKTDYFNKIRERIKKEVKDKFKDEEPEELFDKLYTFFSSYFSDGGAILFSSTPIYKNIYAKVYSDREDTALFWKTAKLYYVKSEANYKSVKDLSINSDPEIAFDFDFDASLLKHKQSNEKKELEFYFVGIQKRGGKKIIKFRVLYKNDNEYSKIASIFKLKGKPEIMSFLAKNIGKIKNSKVEILDGGLDSSKLSEKGNKEMAKIDFVVTEDKNKKGNFTIEPAISEVSEIEKYLILKGVVLNEEELKKAFRIYKKQTEIDYFIHKDAKGFLREQFDLYMFQRLAGNMETIFSQESLDKEKKIKEIAYLAIDFIGNFEDELKKIWLKPKFARNSNYVITLDRIVAKKHGLELIKEIVKGKKVKDQIVEWQDLGIIDKKFDIKTILTRTGLEKKFEHLPIDTKHFKDIELDILGLFDDLDNELDGRLIKSDNFQALNTLLPKYQGQVQTIYIDPPFNTGDDFAYIDRFQDSTWLTLMENRLELASDFIINTGSLFLHLDQNANNFGKTVLDKILGKNNFRNEIIWQYFMGGKGDKEFGRKHDNILFYSKTEAANQFKKIKIKRYLDFKPSLQDESEDGENGKDEIGYFSIVSCPDVWPIRGVFNMGAEYRAFKTQKPEKLIYRIIDTTTIPGNTVFDFFAGSGTTLSVAQKMRRKWVGVEMGNHFNTFYLDETSKQKIGVVGILKKVLFGKIFGISEELNIQEQLNIGGFFKYYDLEQYEDVLRRAAYSPSEKELENIDFSLSEKLSKDGLALDLKREKVSFIFEKLYPDVDIAETISNLYGKKIKKITQNKLILEGDFEIDLKNLDFDKYEPLKKLIYW